MAHPPSKRRKLDACQGSEPEVVDNVFIKRELSPSPPPSLALRTTGTKHVRLPLPCRKTQAGWKEYRDKWVIEEIAKLKSLGLKVTKKLVRDDGLALDWASSVPVCPVTLQAPAPKVEPVQENTLPQVFASSVGSSLDPLGHALRDQSSLAGLPIANTPDKPAIHNEERKEHVLNSVSEEVPRAASNFAVVGTALLKKGSSTDQTTNMHLCLDEPTQSEHRKLFPMELRIPPSLTAGRETFKEWKAKRRAWVAREMEKVEGYTGEHAHGFKYDGDDVIIFLQRRRTPYDKGRRTGKYVPSSPARGILSKSTGANNVSHPARFKQSDFFAGLLKKRGGEDAPETSTNATPGLSAASRKAVDEPSSQHSETNAMVHPIRDPPPQAIRPNSYFKEPDTDDAWHATQARGLDFLKQYLQMFNTDREGLISAYTANATHCLRTEERYCSIKNAPILTSRGHASSVAQITNTGPSAIIGTLRQLPTHLHHSPFRDITYNLAALDDLSTGGILLTCDGIMVRPDHPMQTPEWSFSRTFVLKQNSEESQNLWSMKIVAERLEVCEFLGP